MAYPNCTLDDVCRALGFIGDLAYVRDQWVNVGNAIKGEFGEAGLQPWLDWSSGYKRYKEREAIAVWRSLRAGCVPIGYIFKLAIAAGYTKNQQAYTDEQKKAFELQRKNRMLDIKMQQVRDDALIDFWHKKIRLLCTFDIMPLTKSFGPSPYLGKKKVCAYGVRFPAEAFLIVITGDIAGVITGKEKITEAFARYKNNPDASLRFVRPGDLIIPMRDAAGVIWNLQIINKNGTKKFLRMGKKKGLYHWIGDPGSDYQAIGICEGYATGATCHQAVGWPIAVAFDCGNLLAVAVDVRAGHKEAVIILMADDDWDTPGNPGVTKASEAAKLVGAAVCIPTFKCRSHESGNLEVVDRVG